MFIKYVQESEGRARVSEIHYETTFLSEEYQENGLEVESIPEYENIPGKNGILYVNPETKELWYEYVDRPLSTEEQIQQLLDANAELTYQLMMKGVL